LNEDEAEEEEEKSSTLSDQKGESTETTAEPSNDLRKFFSRHFLHDVDCGMNLDFRYPSPSVECIASINFVTGYLHLTFVAINIYSVSI
jgi:hypothetical protein